MRRHAEPGVARESALNQERRGAQYEREAKYAPDDPQKQV